MNKDIPVQTDTTTASQQFNMGSDFGVCGKLTVIAESADGEQSEAKEADFTVMSKPFAGVYKPTDNADNFHYSKDSSPYFKVIDYLAEKADDDLPIFGKNAVGFKLIPNFNLEITSEGKATIKMDWAGLKSPEFKNFVKIGGTALFEIKPIVSGKATFKNCEWQWKGEIGGSGKGKIGFAQQVPTMGPVPIPWYFKVELGLGLDGSLIIKQIDPMEFNG